MQHVIAHCSGAIGLPLGPAGELRLLPLVVVIVLTVPVRIHLRKA